MTEEKKDISSLGEFGLIDYLTKDLTISRSTTIRGIGDDCAVLEYNGKKVLVTTDLLVEGIHFDLMYTPLKHLGYKAAIVNFSDIAAMNSYPEQILVSIALSSKITLAAIEELYSGIKLACQKYNVDLIGGDTTTSKTGLMISITAIGQATENICYRDTAKINDVICVTGDLGAAYAGLLVLEREKRMFLKMPDVQPELKGYDYVLKRFLKPEARTDVVRSLEELKVVPTSMIDISDGLASELFHICTRSNVGCKVFEDKIPIDDETYETIMSFNIDPLTAVFNGGEDYELLFTISLKDHEKLKNHPDITMIGYITDRSEGLNLITKQGSQVELKAQGWDHFRSKI